MGENILVSSKKALIRTNSQRHDGTGKRSEQQSAPVSQQESMGTYGDTGGFRPGLCWAANCSEAACSYRLDEPALNDERFFEKEAFPARFLEKLSFVECWRRLEGHMLMMGRRE